MVFTELPKVRDVKVLFSANAKEGILAIVFGITKDVKLFHRNDHVQRSVILVGIVICVNKFLLNAHSHNVVTHFHKLSAVNLFHQNAQVHIYVTLSGIFTDDNKLLSNADSSKMFTLFGIITDVNSYQANACTQIFSTCTQAILHGITTSFGQDKL
jgi:hypothetical protein